ncbi:hypothetical protein [Spirochaeta cellobiosiphila]|uniref:hypothetical protein n=1 Tax=Spirochaeta cellobiosiphila TaxID=504483 RepID=UPI00040E2D36|nr:hypothetical protein [Spirochaeta cellobiosiphila]
MNRDVKNRLTIGGILVLLAVLFSFAPYQKNMYDHLLFSLLMGSGLLIIGRYAFLVLSDLTINEEGIKPVFFHNWGHFIPWDDIFEIEICDSHLLFITKSCVQIVYQNPWGQIRCFRITKSFLTHDVFGLLVYEAEKAIPQRIRYTSKSISLRV